MSELNSKVGNNDIEPWMTELWVWADMSYAEETVEINLVN